MVIHPLKKWKLDCIINLAICNIFFCCFAYTHHEKFYCLKTSQFSWGSLGFIHCIFEMADSLLCSFPHFCEDVAECNKSNSPPLEGWPRSGRGGCDTVCVMLHPATACRAGSVVASTKKWILHEVVRDHVRRGEIFFALCPH